MSTFQRGEFTTYYEEAGAGDPLVLICGLSADLQIWRFMVPELSKHFRVVCFDNRGAGRSSAPDEPYSVSGMADDLVNLLNHLHIDSTHVLGWSMGGVIAQTLARSHPARIHKLILLSTCHEPDGLLRLSIQNWINVRRSNMPYEQVIRYLARMVFSPELVNNAGVFQQFIEVMLANPYAQSLHGFLRQAEALLGYSAPSDVAPIAVPSLVLVGRHDQLTPPYLSEQLAARIPNAKVLVLGGAHSAAVESPDEYSRAIVSFLRSNET
jgi:3-oxoadipate enol-lactonase